MEAYSLSDSEVVVIYWVCLIQWCM